MPCLKKCRCCLLSAASVVIFVFLVDAQVSKTPMLPSTSNMVVTVVNENDVGVPSAEVSMRASRNSPAMHCETNFGGHCSFQAVPKGIYELSVAKEGYYLVSGQAVLIGAEPEVKVRLSHLQEVRETVNVVATPPTIDVSQVQASEELTGIDILNIPYPATHDYRNVLGFIPGVVPDSSGQPHIQGAETYQSLTMLDGFNVTQPANGLLLLRISTDAIRLINVQASRLSAEYGKGSGGALGIETGIGDDKLHYSATNFLPSAQLKKGLHFDQVVPRVTVSGPIMKRRLWFFEGLDGEYEHIIIPELPSRSDTDVFWRGGNIAKVQWNLSRNNVLTISYLYNIQHDQYLGLSLFSPPPTTPWDKETGNFVMIRDQHYFSGGTLLDFGFNFDRYRSRIEPQGPGVSVIATSQQASGSYYLTLNTQADRWQAVSNLSLAPRQWHGRHEIKFGLDADRLRYSPLIDRNPISYLRAGQTVAAGIACLTLGPGGDSPCARYSAFTPGNGTKLNAEASTYLQDRWSAAERLLIELGVRFDGDEIVRHALFSPRLGATYALDAGGNTKLSAGIGIYYDATNLVLLARPFSGERFDYFFTNTGVPIPGPTCPQFPLCPVVEAFTLNQSSLHEPRSLNWSLALEHRLPHDIYLKAEFIQRQGKDGFVYDLPRGSPPPSGVFVLQNSRRDRYDGFQIGARHAFHKTYLLAGSYLRSRTRSNQVLDFNVDNPIHSAQLPGPYSWDAPNRFLSTGILPVRVPLLHAVDVEYSAEARTGFPFYVINKQQQLVLPPGTYRFPTYFSLNLFLEKRFQFHHHHWALRGGFDNIMNRSNPAIVNNNIESPQFLTYGALSHRAFTSRIRLIK